MFWSWLRVAAALAALSGIIAGFIVNVDRAGRHGQDLGMVLANYFSFFTIISALLSIIVFVAAAAWSLRNPGRSPEPFAIALGLATVAGPVILLGVVFNVLLRGAPSADAIGDPAGIAFLDSWATEVLHVVLPLYFVVDLLFAPRRRALPWWSLGVLVAYPLAWVVYTMLRGEMVPNPDGSAPWWYPYPFLDPHGAGGYPSALIYIGVLTVALLAIGALIIQIGVYRAGRASRRSGESALSESVPRMRDHGARSQD